MPEVAFTGDTTSDFITNKANQDALNAKLLIMEVKYLIMLCFQLQDLKIEVGDQIYVLICAAFFVSTSITLNPFSVE